jgi:hypothetical protein
MIISQEFVDGLDIFATKWLQKQFSSADDLYDAIDELHAFAVEHREIDYVEVNLSKPDAPTQPLTNG